MINLFQVIQVLDSNNYLYYTNNATEGKLLIDLRKSYYSKIPLQPRGDSDLNYQSIPFYEEFDLNEDNQNLYSIYYLGVNSSSVSKYKIKNLEKKFDVYGSIYIVKIVFFCLEYTLLIITFILFLCENRIYYKYNCFKELEKVLISFLIISGIMYLLNCIFVVVCLDCQIKYVLDLINKINFDFENNKIDYKWNVAILIHSLFIFIYIALFFCFDNKIEFMDRNYKKEIEHENRESDVVYRRNIISSTTDRNVEKYENKIKNLTDENDKLNKEIINISNEKNNLIKGKKALEQNILDIKTERDNLIEEKKNLEKNNQNIIDEKNTLKKEKENLKKDIINITNEKDTLKKEKENLERDIINITNEKNTLKKEKDILMIENYNYKKRYEEIINNKNEDKYKIKYVLPGEEVMTINFVSMGVNDIGHYSLDCKNTDLFIKQEERLYEDFPLFKKYNALFKVDGRTIKRFLTLEENKIKNKAVISIFIFEDDENDENKK